MTHVSLHSPEGGAIYRLHIIQGFLFLDCMDAETGAVERAIGMPLSHGKAREVRALMDGYVGIFEGEKLCLTE